VGRGYFGHVEIERVVRIRAARGRNRKGDVRSRGVFIRRCERGLVAERGGNALIDLSKEHDLRCERKLVRGWVARQEDWPLNSRRDGGCAGRAARNGQRPA